MEIELKYINDVGITKQQTSDKQKQLSKALITSNSYFQYMMEDCLREIFTLKLLTPMDFCSVAETCERFRIIIQSLVPTKLFIRNYGSGLCDVRWEHLSRDYVENEVERVLKNFGSILSDLLLTDFESPYLVELAFNYCGKNLNILRVQNSFIPEITTAKLTQLTSLHLEAVDIARNASFAGLISLVDLRLNEVRNSKAVLVNHFPKLIHFAYIGNTRRASIPWYTRMFAKLPDNPLKKAESFRSCIESLSNFFHLNNKLKTIDLKLNDFVEGDTVILKKIVSSCKELDVVRVNCGRALYTYFGEPYTAQGYLELSEASCQHLEIFSSFTTFHTLSLYSCPLPTPSQFVSFARLTRLDLNAFRFPNMLDVVGIIRQLVNLKQLRINTQFIYGQPFVLNEETFGKICKLVNGRDRVLTMLCAVDFAPKVFERNDKIHLIGRPRLAHGKLIFKMK